MSSTLPYADISWRDGSIPQSDQHDDIYYSPANGLEESLYHFVDSNNLKQRFSNLETPYFTIGETGFGTGLNFLITAQIWKELAPKSAHLTFISVEAFPLKQADLEKAHSYWPSLSPFSKILRDHIPTPTPGLHAVEFPDWNITLLLQFGDAAQCYSKASASVDAWFLDGFAPSRNPDMWTESLFAEIGRLSHTNTTVGSFTAAGKVRRGLEAVGFSITKRKGYGYKRDCIQATFIGEQDKASPPSDYKQAPWFHLPEMGRDHAPILILGAGIAGLSLGHHLSQLRQAFEIHDAASEIAAGASGNLAGIMDPALANDDSVSSQFHRSAYLYALDFYQALQKNCDQPLFNSDGLVRLAFKDSQKKRYDRLVGAKILPDKHLAKLSSIEASALTGMESTHDGIFLKSALSPYPHAIVSALAADLPITFNSPISSLQTCDDGWEVKLGGKSHHFKSIIFAGGARLTHWLNDQLSLNLPLQSVAGQVSYLDPQQLDFAPKCPVSFGAYITPVVDLDNAKEAFILGASFDPVEAGYKACVTQEAHRKNLSDFHKTFPHLSIPESAIIGGRAAIRATTPDRMPLVGPIYDPEFYESHYGDLHFGRHISRYEQGRYFKGLYIFSGFGSRGFQTAPLSAAFLARLLTQNASPLHDQAQMALHPARFTIRNAKRAGRT